MICAPPDHASQKLSAVRVGGGHSMTGGVPDSSRELGRALSPDGDREGGS